MSYKPLYVAYLIYFNRDQDYFECHEVLEELWLEENRDPFYKGMLQVAVGLYHFRNNNVSGALKMLRYASDRLLPYRDDMLGINLAQLRSEVNEYIIALEHYDARPFPYYDLTIDIQDTILKEEVERMSPEITPNIPQRRSPQRGAKHEQRQRNLDSRK
jgi:predicted metal-dependent hydrolase